MLSAFGDESSDSKKRVYAVGCLLGDHDTWNRLRLEWLKITAGRVLHAADCESGYGEFSDVGEDDRHKLLRNLTRALAESGLLGLASVVEMEGPSKSFPEALAAYPLLPYFDCLYRTLLRTADQASVFVPADTLEFTFDQQRKVECNAGIVYSWVRKISPLIAERLKFASRENVAIQASDLWVREVMKRANSRISAPGSDPRLYWTTLASSDRFKAELLTSQAFDSMAKHRDEALERYQIDDPQFNVWLSAKKRPRNLSDWLEFVVETNPQVAPLMRLGDGEVVML